MVELLFKKQKVILEDQYVNAAKYASKFMDVVTTSGVATGKEAKISKFNYFVLL